ncbi:MAG: response regulator, partial [Candidatus Omnitrophota bacterium]
MFAETQSDEETGDVRKDTELYANVGLWVSVGMVIIVALVILLVLGVRKWLSRRINAPNGVLEGIRVSGDQGLGYPDIGVLGTKYLMVRRASLVVRQAHHPERSRGTHHESLWRFMFRPGYPDSPDNPVPPQLTYLNVEGEINSTQNIVGAALVPNTRITRSLILHILLLTLLAAAVGLVLAHANISIQEFLFGSGVICAGIGLGPISLKETRTRTSRVGTKDAQAFLRAKILLAQRNNQAGYFEKTIALVTTRGLPIIHLLRARKMSEEEQKLFYENALSLYAQLIEAQLSLGRYREAAKTSREACRVFPEKNAKGYAAIVKLLVIWGNRLRKNNDLKDVENLLETAVEIAGEIQVSLISINSLAYLYNLNGRFEETVKLVTSRGLPNINFLRGPRIGRAKMDRRLFDNNALSVYMEFVRALMGLGWYQEAVASLQEARRAFPKDNPHYSYIAEMVIKQTRDEKNLADIELLLKTTLGISGKLPIRLTSLRHLIHFYVEQNRHQEAARDLRQALDHVALMDETLERDSEGYVFYLKNVIGLYEIAEKAYLRFKEHYRDIYNDYRQSPIVQDIVSRQARLRARNHALPSGDFSDMRAEALALFARGAYNTSAYDEARVILMAIDERFPDRRLSGGWTAQCFLGEIDRLTKSSRNGITERPSKESKNEWPNSVNGFIFADMLLWGEISIGIAMLAATILIIFSWRIMQAVKRFIKEMGGYFALFTVFLVGISLVSASWAIMIYKDWTNILAWFNSQTVTRFLSTAVLVFAAILVWKIIDRKIMKCSELIFAAEISRLEKPIEPQTYHEAFYVKSALKKFLSFGYLTAPHLDKSALTDIFYEELQKTYVLERCWLLKRAPPLACLVPAREGVPLRLTIKNVFFIHVEVDYRAYLNHGSKTQLEYLSKIRLTHGPRDSIILVVFLILLMYAFGNVLLIPLYYEVAHALGHDVSMYYHAELRLLFALFADLFLTVALCAMSARYALKVRKIFADYTIKYRPTAARFCFPFPASAMPLFCLIVINMFSLIFAYFGIVSVKLALAWPYIVFFLFMVSVLRFCQRIWQMRKQEKCESISDNLPGLRRPPVTRVKMITVLRDIPGAKNSHNLRKGDRFIHRPTSQFASARLNVYGLSARIFEKFRIRKISRFFIERIRNHKPMINRSALYVAEAIADVPEKTQRSLKNRYRAKRYLTSLRRWVLIPITLAFALMLAFIPVCILDAVRPHPKALSGEFEKSLDRCQGSSCKRSYYYRPHVKVSEETSDTIFTVSNLDNEFYSGYIASDSDSNQWVNLEKSPQMGRVIIPDSASTQTQTITIFNPPAWDYAPFYTPPGMVSQSHFYTPGVSLDPYYWAYRLKIDGGVVSATYTLSVTDDYKLVFNEEERQGLLELDQVTRDYLDRYFEGAVGLPDYGDFETVRLWIEDFARRKWMYSSGSRWIWYWAWNEYQPVMKASLPAQQDKTIGLQWGGLAFNGYKLSRYFGVPAVAYLGFQNSNEDLALTNDEDHMIFAMYNDQTQKFENVDLTKNVSHDDSRLSFNIETLIRILGGAVIALILLPLIFATRVLQRRWANISGLLRKAKIGEVAKDKTPEPQSAAGNSSWRMLTFSQWIAALEKLRELYEDYRGKTRGGLHQGWWEAWKAFETQRQDDALSLSVSLYRLLEDGKVRLEPVAKQEKTASYASVDVRTTFYRNPIKLIIKRNDAYLVIPGVNAVHAISLTQPLAKKLNSGVYAVVADHWKNAGKDDTDARHQWLADTGISSRELIPSAYGLILPGVTGTLVEVFVVALLLAGLGVLAIRFILKRNQQKRIRAKNEQLTIEAANLSYLAYSGVPLAEPLPERLSIIAANESYRLRRNGWTPAESDESQEPSLPVRLAAQEEFERVTEELHKARAQVAGWFIFGMPVYALAIGAVILAILGVLLWRKSVLAQGEKNAENRIFWYAWLYKHYPITFIILNWPLLTIIAFTIFCILFKRLTGFLNFETYMICGALGFLFGVVIFSKVVETIFPLYFQKKDKIIPPKIIVLGSHTPLDAYVFVCKIIAVYKGINEGVALSAIRIRRNNSAEEVTIDIPSLSDEIISKSTARALDLALEKLKDTLEKEYFANQNLVLKYAEYLSRWELLIGPDDDTANDDSEPVSSRNQSLTSDTVSSLRSFGPVALAASVVLAVLLAGLGILARRFASRQASILQMRRNNQDLGRGDLRDLPLLWSDSRTSFGDSLRHLLDSSSRILWSSFINLGSLSFILDLLRRTNVNLRVIQVLINFINPDAGMVPNNMFKIPAHKNWNIMNRGRGDMNGIGQISVRNNSFLNISVSQILSFLSRRQYFHRVFFNDIYKRLSFSPILGLLYFGNDQFRNTNYERSFTGQLKEISRRLFNPQSIISKHSANNRRINVYPHGLPHFNIILGHTRSQGECVAIGGWIIPGVPASAPLGSFGLSAHLTAEPWGAGLGVLVAFVLGAVVLAAVLGVLLVPGVRKWLARLINAPNGVLEGIRISGDQGLGYPDIGVLGTKYLMVRRASLAHHESLWRFMFRPGYPDSPGNLVPPQLTYLNVEGEINSTQNIVGAALVPNTRITRSPILHILLLTLLAAAAVFGAHVLFNLSGLIVAFGMVEEGDSRLSEGILASGAKPKILLAKDNDVSRKIFAEFLAYRGFQVIKASNGKKALDAFLADSEKTFQIVVTDYNMPCMDGAQLVAEIRKTDPLIPIIMVSGNIDIVKKEITQVVTLFLRKPFDPADIVEHIRGILSVRQEGNQKKEDSDPLYGWIFLSMPTLSIMLPAAAVFLILNKTLHPRKIMNNLNDLVQEQWTRKYWSWGSLVVYLLAYTIFGASYMAIATYFFGGLSLGLFGINLKSLGTIKTMEISIIISIVAAILHALGHINIGPYFLNQYRERKRTNIQKLKDRRLTVRVGPYANLIAGLLYFLYVLILSSHFTKSARYETYFGMFINLGMFLGFAVRASNDGRAISALNRQIEEEDSDRSNESSLAGFGLLLPLGAAVVLLAGLGVLAYKMFSRKSSGDEARVNFDADLRSSLSRETRTTLSMDEAMATSNASNGEKGYSSWRLFAFKRLTSSGTMILSNFMILAISSLILLSSKFFLRLSTKRISKRLTKAADPFSLPFSINSMILWGDSQSGLPDAGSSSLVSQLMMTSLSRRQAVRSGLFDFAIERVPQISDKLGRSAILGDDSFVFSEKFIGNFGLSVASFVGNDLNRLNGFNSFLQSCHFDSSFCNESRPFSDESQAALSFHGLLGPGIIIFIIAVFGLGVLAIGYLAVQREWLVRLINAPNRVLEGIRVSGDQGLGYPDIGVLGTKYLMVRRASLAHHESLW